MIINQSLSPSTGQTLTTTTYLTAFVAWSIFFLVLYCPLYDIWNETQQSLCLFLESLSSVFSSNQIIMHRITQSKNSSQQLNL